MSLMHRLTTWLRPNIADRSDSPTSHSDRCKRARNGDFRNCRRSPTPGCPHCRQLTHGAPARAGWNGTWSAKDDDAQRSREIKAHDCAKKGCGPICTFGDW